MPKLPRRTPRRFAKVHLGNRQSYQTFHVKHFCPIEG